MAVWFAWPLTPYSSKVNICEKHVREYMYWWLIGRHKSKSLNLKWYGMNMTLRGGPKKKLQCIHYYHTHKSMHHTGMMWPEKYMEAGTISLWNWWNCFPNISRSWQDLILDKLTNDVDNTMLHSPDQCNNLLCMEEWLWTGAPCPSKHQDCQGDHCKQHKNQEENSWFEYGTRARERRIPNLWLTMKMWFSLIPRTRQLSMSSFWRTRPWL